MSAFTKTVKNIGVRRELLKAGIEVKGYVWDIYLQPLYQDVIAITSTTNYICIEFLLRIHSSSIPRFPYRVNFREQLSRVQ